MPKTKTKLLSILCAFLIVLGFAIPASATSQQLVIHTLADGAPKDGTSYEVLNYSGVILSFTPQGNGHYSLGGTVNSLTSSGGSIHISGLNEGSYTVRQTIVPTGYEKSNPDTKSAYIQIGQTTDCYFSIAATSTNPTPPPSATGSIRIVNSDAQTGVGLQNGVFAIFDETGGKLQEVTTGFLGEVLLQNMSAGRYAIVQMKAAEGYSPDPAKYTVNVTAGNESVIEIKNSASLGGVKITLTRRATDSNTTSEKLKGGAFAIYKADGSKVGEVTTDTNGEAYLNDLARGNYYTMQTSAPDGYRADTEKHSFTITSGLVHLDIKNAAMTGGMTLLVQEKDTEKVISGAVFGVYRDNGEKISEITTATDGYAYANELEYGKYYLSLLKAPDQYAKQSTRHEFTIAKDKANVNVKLEIAQGKVKLIKLDNQNKGIVASSYEMIDSTGKVVATLTTDKDGTATSENFPCGTYTLKESKAASGYKISSTVHSVTLLADQTVEVRIVGDSKSGTLEILYKHLDDNREIAKKRVYTDAIGTDYMAWVNENNLDKMALTGYRFVKAEYPTESTLTEGTLTITYWYSGSGLAITDECVDEATEEVEIVDEEETAIPSAKPTQKPQAPTMDEVPEENDEWYEEEERASIPQTGDIHAPVGLAISASGLLAAGAFFFIKRKLDVQ